MNLHSLFPDHSPCSLRLTSPRASCATDGHLGAPHEAADWCFCCSVPECRQVDDDHTGAAGAVDEEIIDSLSAALNDVALGVCVECEEVAGDVNCDQCTLRFGCLRAIS